MRNRSVEFIDTRWIAFLDDDVLVDVDYFEALEELLEEPPARVTQGVPFLCSNPEKLLARLEARNYQQGLQTYLRENGKLVTLDARNLLIETQVIRDFPFDEELLFAGEGQDLAARLESAGVTMAYSEALRVFHRNRETASELARQKFFHGRGRAQLLRKKEELDLPGYLRRYAVRHFAKPAQHVATGAMPASDGFYQLATNTVFWAGVLSELALRRRG
jgi:GT2 family glycosyltransferase